MPGHYKKTMPGHYKKTANQSARTIVAILIYDDYSSRSRIQTFLPPRSFYLHYVSNKDLRLLVHNIFTIPVINTINIELLG